MWERCRTSCPAACPKDTHTRTHTCTHICTHTLTSAALMWERCRTSCPAACPKDPLPPGPKATALIRDAWQVGWGWDMKRKKRPESSKVLGHIATLEPHQLINNYDKGQGGEMCSCCHEVCHVAAWAVQAWGDPEPCGQGRHHLPWLAVRLKSSQEVSPEGGKRNERNGLWRR